MSERIKWIECEGYTIMSIDYSDLPEDEHVDTMGEVIQLLQAFQGAPSESSMLVMANVINTQITNRTIGKVRETCNVIGRFNKYAYAIVGEKGTLKQLIKIFTPSIYFTSTEQDARNWLVRQAKYLEKNSDY